MLVEKSLLRKPAKGHPLHHRDTVLGKPSSLTLAPLREPGIQAQHSGAAEAETRP